MLFQVMESEEFLLLPVNQLIDIISSDELNVRSEEQVFKAVMAWVRHNVPERRQYLSQVRRKKTISSFPRMANVALTFRSCNTSGCHYAIRNF